MTEGTGHVIDPDGDARRAVHEAVAERGPEVLSDATIMENLCRTQLTALPGECILIVSAARADVPALLRDKIPQLGNYGAIQSVATTLAGAHDLDNAASLWVVREFARALGLIAPGGTGSGAALGQRRPGDGCAGGVSGGSGVQGGPGAPTGPGVLAGPGVPTGPRVPGRARSSGRRGCRGAGDGAGAGAGAGARGPRGSSGSRVLNRNTVGVAAAIALVAGYLGVAAAAHLSPFPAKTVAATASQSQSPSTRPSTSTSPAGSPDASPDPSPTSDYDVLLSKIPSAVKSQSNCPNAGTQYGAIAVAECSRLSLAAGTIFYYLYPSSTALASGVSSFLKGVKFHKERECTTGSDFTDFLVECQSDFNNKTPFMTGSVAEYTSKGNAPIIVTSDRQQNVMVILVGTNAGDLLAYWKQLNWIVD